MIVRSTFRCQGGLAPHLENKDKNETVQVEVGFLRDAPERTADALAMFAVLSETNARTKRHFLHIKISPDHPLSDQELEATLAVIEQEFGIARTVPRHVTRHAKGARADHFHAVFPIIDPATGRAIKSHGNYLKDETISRRLELQFGEKITPGPRQDAVVDTLIERGHSAEAAILSQHKPTKAGLRLDTGIRQQSERVGMDPKKLARTVEATWAETFGQQTAFEAVLATHDLALAKGNSAVLVVDQKTGGYASLVRLLRAAAKESGQPVKFKADQIERQFSGLRPLDEVRDVGLDTHARLGSAAVGLERQKLRKEEILDGEAEAQLLKDKEIKRSTIGAEEIKTTFKARREAVRAAFAERDRIRRLRVDRAFRSARLMDSKPLRRLAFAAAAVGVVLAGGGLGWALVLGGLAASALPSRENARRLALEAKGERQIDFIRQRERLEAVYREWKLTVAPEPAPVPKKAPEPAAPRVQPRKVVPRQPRQRDVGPER